MIIPAERNWSLFVDIYNRSTVYAPFSIPLTNHLVEEYFVPFHQNHDDFAAIGDNGRGRGIIHVGNQPWLEKGSKENVGVVYMLLADNNDIACSLLEAAEEWFAAKGMKKILAFWWYPNPYKYILHGAETYGWAGAYPMVNAFRRRDYDLALDILVMRKVLSGVPTISLPEMSGLEFTFHQDTDNELAVAGTVEAKLNGKHIGYCGFQYLQALSKHLNKGIGQINIGAGEEFHGKGIGPALISYAHKQLYELGAREVILATNQALFRAIKFYTKLGYHSEPIRAYSFSKGL